VGPSVGRAFGPAFGGSSLPRAEMSGSLMARSNQAPNVSRNGHPSRSLPSPLAPGAAMEVVGKSTFYRRPRATSDKDNSHRKARWVPSRPEKGFRIHPRRRSRLSHRSRCQDRSSSVVPSERTTHVRLESHPNFRCGRMPFMAGVDRPPSEGGRKSEPGPQALRLPSKTPSKSAEDMGEQCVHRLLRPPRRVRPPSRPSRGNLERDAPRAPRSNAMPSSGSNERRPRERSPRAKRTSTSRRTEPLAQAVAERRVGAGWPASTRMA